MNIYGRKKENTTKYGEQVCSEFAWLPLDKQKEKAEKLDKITKKKIEKNNKLYKNFLILLFDYMVSKKN